MTQGEQIVDMEMNIVSPTFMINEDYEWPLNFQALLLMHPNY